MKEMKIGVLLALEEASVKRHLATRRSLFRWLEARHALRDREERCGE
jgi:hypothetical protein